MAQRTGPRPAPATIAWWVLAGALPLLFLAVFFAWPVASLMGRGFTGEQGGLDLSGTFDVLARPRTWRLVRNSLTQGVVGAGASLVLGLPLAYLLYRTRFRGRIVLRGLVTVPFVLPTVVVGVAFQSLLWPGGALAFLGWQETFWAVLLSLIFFNVAVVARTVGGLWERLDPRAEEAARALGASPWRALRTVTLPSLTPAIASAGAVVFLFCATAFGVVMILGGAGYNTVETEIFRRTTQFLDLRTAAVLSILQLVVVAVALIVASRARARRERALRLESERRAAHAFSWRRGADAVAAVTSLVVVGGFIVFPLGGLVTRALQNPDGSFGVHNFRALGTTGQGNALAVTVWEALGNSLRIAAVATVIALVTGGLLAVVLSRRPRRRGGRQALAWLDSIVMLPLGVSAITVGFGFLITLDRPLGLHIDLRTSGLLIPIAQAVVALPLVLRTLLPVMRAIDPRLKEAATVLGASPRRVLGTVDLALATRSFGLAAGFAFAVSLGEFGATAFLARPGGATLPVVIFRLIGRPGAENYGMALAASVVLAVLTAMVMILAESLRTSSSTQGEF